MKSKIILTGTIAALGKNVSRITMGIVLKRPIEDNQKKWEEYLEKLATEKNLIVVSKTAEIDIINSVIFNRGNILSFLSEAGGILCHGFSLARETVMKKTGAHQIYITQVKDLYSKMNDNDLIEIVRNKNFTVTIRKI